jgi:hypothetical protein
MDTSQMFDKILLALQYLDLFWFNKSIDTMVNAFVEWSQWIPKEYGWLMLLHDYVLDMWLNISWKYCSLSLWCREYLCANTPLQFQL